MLNGVRRALEADGDFEIVGETQDGTQVIAIVTETVPDLVLLDVRMPGMDGLACLDEIHKRFPEIKVVMLSASTSPELIAAARRRGASAYLAKSVEPDDLPSTLRLVFEGSVWRGVEEADANSARDTSKLGLTGRETVILLTLSRGLSNGDIAKELWVTEQTVKFHLTNIYRKLGARNRTQAIRIAQQNGLVDNPLHEEG